MECRVSGVGVTRSGGAEGGLPDGERHNRHVARGDFFFLIITLEPRGE